MSKAAVFSHLYRKKLAVLETADHNGYLYPILLEITFDFPKLHGCANKSAPAHSQEAGEA